MRVTWMLPLLFPFFKRLLGPIPVNSMSEGQGTAWMSCWWQSLPHKVPTACQEQFRGSVSSTRILRHAAQFRPREAGIQTSDLPITSPPALPTELQPKSATLTVNILIAFQPLGEFAVKSMIYETFLKHLTKVLVVLRIIIIISRTTIELIRIA